ncbi:MAG: thioredoxin family protein [Pseudomonadales bacterium]|jgi:hypothetical protein|uniref:glutaredoxin family protein n=1 Tax=unclassified Ketobacter TaxID=2639109 RepID=UPI000C3A6DF7|nr:MULTISPECIES: glutaredoxin family protein [unclassified Ketobacter]MAQ27513.1 thioredoxin family protein [Pseudomonadales bacterium]MEC8810712.1 glutaredoxin family protein [Pseudomonadota bacterium]TNC88853.1 MAG: thioredoxin family protein [Alcanivorax sp.]HAG94359.1 thioredoxin family protein [Gammaproteobacteria bacterium]MBI26675.1 thioredoxin family protein [Pseudomonadales bacterium]|tara:strand:- start:46312 stop:46554 length:243 start_codon:yes stop_codon:yes gene_type:complete
MKEELVFYTTAGCHLCDVARQIYQATLAPEYFEVREVDIAHSDTLVERYGTRIPVIRRMRDDTELNWPFDQQALVDFLPE